MSNAHLNLFNRLDFAHIVHDFVRCDCCSKTLQGIRYKCLQCLNFDLCDTCVTRFPHMHSDYIALAYSGVHESIGCDGCGQAPIIGLRYQDRRHVNYDLCHPCFLALPEQSYDDWQVVPPLSLHIEKLFDAEKKRYFEGENLFVNLIISNLTLVNLDRLTLQCVGGSPPFAFEEASYQLDMRFGQIQVIRLGGVLARPGNYKVAFQFRSDLYQERIGELIELVFEIRAKSMLKRLIKW